MKVSWDDDIPNILSPTEWKVIKFHGSKPPTSKVDPDFGNPVAQNTRDPACAFAGLVRSGFGRGAAPFSGPTPGMEGLGGETPNLLGQIMLNPNFRWVNHNFCRLNPQFMPFNSPSLGLKTGVC